MLLRYGIYIGVDLVPDVLRLDSPKRAAARNRARIAPITTSEFDWRSGPDAVPGQQSAVYVCIQSQHALRAYQPVSAMALLSAACRGTLNATDRIAITPDADTTRF